MVLRFALAVMALTSSASAQTTFTDVHPVFVTKCSACHAVAGFGGFDIANANIQSAYLDSQLPSYYSPGQTKGFASYARILDSTMPLGGGCSGDPAMDAGNTACLTAGQQALVLAWLQDGQLGPVPSTGATFCFGDDSGTPCPCGNAGLADGGCANSVDPRGGKLTASGAASVAADGLVLRGTRMSNGSALYFQGTLPVSGGTGTVFGDGLSCAHGTIIRLGTKTNVGGVSQYPAGGDALVSVRGQNVPGNVRTYQAWYRNAASFCTSETFNLTNGVRLTWTL